MTRLRSSELKVCPMPCGTHKVFRSLSTVTLVFHLLTPKSNQHIYEPKYICDQNCVKFPSLVFEIWCSQDFQDAQTHALMNGQTRIQYVSSTVFQRWQRHNKLNWKLIDTHAHLLLPVLLAIELVLRCNMCDLHSKFEEDRIKTTVAIVD